MLLWQKLNSRVFVCTLWLLWRMKNGDPLRARQTDRERGGESRKVMNLVLISTSPKESGCTYQGGPMLSGHFIYIRKVDRNSFRLLYESNYAICESLRRAGDHSSSKVLNFHGRKKKFSRQTRVRVELTKKCMRTEDEYKCGMKQGREEEERGGNTYGRWLRGLWRSLLFPFVKAILVFCANSSPGKKKKEVIGNQSISFPLLPS